MTSNDWIEYYKDDLRCSFDAVEDMGDDDEPQYDPNEDTVVYAPDLEAASLQDAIKIDKEFTQSSYIVPEHILIQEDPPHPIQLTQVLTSSIITKLR
jgi:hypothetical protein